MVGTVVVPVRFRTDQEMVAEFRARLSVIDQLQDGWDGPGSVAPDAKTIEEACLVTTMIQCGIGLYAWNVGRLRELRFDVVADPVEDEPAHANVVHLVVVSDSGRPWTRTLRRELIAAGR